jgi:hypothetical protein
VCDSVVANSYGSAVEVSTTCLMKVQKIRIGRFGTAHGCIQNGNVCAETPSCQVPVMSTPEGRAIVKAPPV